MALCVWLPYYPLISLAYTPIFTYIPIYIAIYRYPNIIAYIPISILISLIATLALPTAIRHYRWPGMLSVPVP